MTIARRIRRIDLITLAALGLAIAYALQFRRFLTQFPTSYAWSDLMIAYQGGYVRRGMLGHLAFLLDDTLGARPFLAGVVALSYVAVILFYARAARRAGPWIGMLFVLSPATLLFPLLDPEAFGRKDALILTTFALSLTAARAFGRGAALTATALAYAAANLVVDSAIFYAPMAAFAGCWIAPARQRRGTGAVLKASLASSVLLLGLSEVNLLLNAKFREDNILGYQQIIASAWRARYPDAFQPNSAVEYIGMSVWDGIDLVVQDVSVHPTFLFYLLGLLLALVPLAALARRIRWDAVGRWERACGLQAVACGFLPFVFAADWGRYIHLLAMQGFVLMLCLPQRPRTAAPPATPAAAWTRRLALAAAILVYATGWRMMHFVEGGGSAVAPGLAFARP